MRDCPFCKSEATLFRVMNPLGYQIQCSNKRCGAKTRVYDSLDAAETEWESNPPHAYEVAAGVNIQFYDGDQPPPRYDKPPLGVTPKVIWLEHRARELSDHICRLLDVPEIDINAAIDASCELNDVLHMNKNVRGV